MVTAAAKACGSASEARPLAQGAIADLVVILQADDESGGRQIGRILATRRAVMRRDLSLVDKTFGHGTGQMLGGGVGKTFVIPFGFAGEQHVDAMMPIIGPLRVEAF